MKKFCLLVNDSEGRLDVVDVDDEKVPNVKVLFDKAWVEAPLGEVIASVPSIDAYAELVSTGELPPAEYVFLFDGDVVCLLLEGWELGIVDCVPYGSSHE